MLLVANGRIIIIIITIIYAKLDCHIIYYCDKNKI